MAAAIHPVTMPKWGIEMTEGTLNNWSVTEGAQVNKGDPLLEVETDKIVNTVESPAAGRLRRIVASVGQTLPVGSLVAILADESVSDADINSFITGFKGASVSFEPDGGADAPQPSVNAPTSGAGATTPGVNTPLPGEDVRVSPFARRLAQSLGVDLAKVTGTGRNGRISKEDVENHAARMQGAPTGGASSAQDAAGAQPASAQRPAGPPADTGANLPTILGMSATRSTIARRLLESRQTIPHYRLCRDVEVGRLRGRRAELAASAGLKITLNDMLVRAAALALLRHPAVNAQFDGEQIHQYPHADIAIAVATDAGLITPIVRSADLKSVVEISRQTAALAAKAKDGTLRRDEITGGTFTISNLGMLGVSHFDAIINPPQVAILAVGAAGERVVARNGAAVVEWMMTLTLSADHRVVDGAAGAAFLASLRDLLQAPESL